MQKFDRNGDRTITFDDFIQCCVLIQVTLSCNLLRSFNYQLLIIGYNLSSKFYKLVLRKFDRDGSKRISFDDFIQCIVIIQVSNQLCFDSSFVRHLCDSAWFNIWSHCGVYFYQFSHVVDIPKVHFWLFFRHCLRRSSGRTPIATDGSR